MDVLLQKYGGEFVRVEGRHSIYSNEKVVIKLGDEPADEVMVSLEEEIKTHKILKELLGDSLVDIVETTNINTPRGIVRVLITKFGGNTLHALYYPDVEFSVKDIEWDRLPLDVAVQTKTILRILKENEYHFDDPHGDNFVYDGNVVRLIDCEFIFSLNPLHTSLPSSSLSSLSFPSPPPPIF